MSRRRAVLTIDAIMQALREQTLSTIGWRVLQFDSGEQTPRIKISTTGIRGPVEDVYLGDESLQVFNLLMKRLGAPGGPATVWKWITDTPGVDVTAILDQDGKIKGAALGYLTEGTEYAQRVATYVTMLTAAARNAPPGIGTTLRRHQVERVNHKLGRQPLQENFKLRFVSYSALPNDEDPRGAVGFQQNFFTKIMEWTEGTREEAERVLAELHTHAPHLNLDAVREQPVLPLMFIDD